MKEVRYEKVKERKKERKVLKAEGTKETIPVEFQRVYALVLMNCA
jgi:hypothetical protein